MSFCWQLLLIIVGIVISMSISYNLLGDKSDDTLRIGLGEHVFKNFTKCGIENLVVAISFEDIPTIYKHRAIKKPNSQRAKVLPSQASINAEIKVGAMT